LPPPEYTGSGRGSLFACQALHRRYGQVSSIHRFYRDFDARFQVITIHADGPPLGIAKAYPANTIGKITGDFGTLPDQTRGPARTQSELFEQVFRR